MAPNLRLAFTIQVFIDSSKLGVLRSPPAVPYRVIAPVSTGTIRFIGPDVKAEICSPSADWLLVDETSGYANVDVRLRALTDQDEIYLQYTGRTKIDAAASAFLILSPEAKTTDFADEDWVVIPILKTGDGRLKWLETVQLLGEGRWLVDGDQRGVEYAVYTVMSGTASS